jgi:hypothetical protein
MCKTNRPYLALDYENHIYKVRCIILGYLLKTVLIRGIA